MVVKTCDVFDELKLSRFTFRRQLSIAQRLRAQTYTTWTLAVNKYTKRFQNGPFLQWDQHLIHNERQRYFSWFIYRIIMNPTFWVTWNYLLLFHILQSSIFPLGYRYLLCLVGIVHLSLFHFSNHGNGKRFIFANIKNDITLF